MVGEVGLEPTTSAPEGLRSRAMLSYSPITALAAVDFRASFAGLDALKCAVCRLLTLLRGDLLLLSQAGLVATEAEAAQGDLAGAVRELERQLRVAFLRQGFVETGLDLGHERLIDVELVAI